MDITKNWKIQKSMNIQHVIDKQVNLQGIAFYVDGETHMKDIIINIIKKQLKNKTRYLIGNEGESSSDRQPRPHYHIWIPKDEKAYTNIIKNIKDHYKLNGETLGGKNNKKATKYYGRTKEIKDELKMKAYTIKEGKYESEGFHAETIKHLVKVGFSKETEKHCKGCQCNRHKKMEQIITHMKQYYDIGHKDIKSESIRKYVETYNQIPNKQMLLKIWYKIGYIDEYIILDQLNIKDF